MRNPRPRIAADHGASKQEEEKIETHLSLRNLFDPVNGIHERFFVLIARYRFFIIVMLFVLITRYRFFIIVMLFVFFFVVIILDADFARV